MGGARVTNSPPFYVWGVWLMGMGIYIHGLVFIYMDIYIWLCIYMGMHIYGYVYVGDSMYGYLYIFEYVYIWERFGYVYIWVLGLRVGVRVAHDPVMFLDQAL